MFVLHPLDTQFHQFYHCDLDCHLRNFLWWSVSWTLLSSLPNFNPCKQCEFRKHWHLVGSKVLHCMENSKQWNPQRKADNWNNNFDLLLGAHCSLPTGILSDRILWLAVFGNYVQQWNSSRIPWSCRLVL